jgi:hypothetical protein
VTDELRELDQFLDGMYIGHERVTRDEIQRRAVAAELPATLMTRIDALPEGEYTLDEAADVLHGTAA